MAPLIGLFLASLVIQAAITDKLAGPDPGHGLRQQGKGGGLASALFHVKNPVMTSLIIILVSALAIAALIGLNAWMGGWTPSRVESLEAAVTRLRQDLLSFEPADGVMAKDQRAAIILEKNTGRIGLVVAQGDILVTRLITPSEISKAEIDDTVLALRFRDFTFPDTKFAFDDAEAAAKWLVRLTGDIEIHDRPS